MVDTVAHARGEMASTPPPVQSSHPNVVPHRSATHTVAEFFAGIGLMRLGLEEQGWRVTFANDIDEKKLEMYAGQFDDASEHFVLGDIHKLPSEAVPDVTLATASFPCTDLSLAGARDGLSGRESSAFWGFTTILEGMGPRRPPLVLLENVTGFLTSHKGDDFLAAMQTLNALGYSVDALVLDAMWFVPQSRQRLFVVGTRDDVFGTVPSPPPCESRVRPAALVAYMKKHHDDIRWRIRELPTPEVRQARLMDILEDLPDAHPMWWSEARATKLLNQMSPRHREIADAMIAADTWSYGTVFRRMRENRTLGEKQSMAELRTDGIAGCLRTPKGGSAKQILFKAGYGRYSARLLTPREAARLMGADEYMLPASLDQAYFGFGDAVCVPVVSWVAEQYLNPLMREYLHQPSLQVVK